MRTVPDKILFIQTHNCRCRGQRIHEEEQNEIRKPAGVCKTTQKHLKLGSMRESSASVLFFHLSSSTFTCSAHLNMPVPTRLQFQHWVAKHTWRGTARSPLHPRSSLFLSPNIVLPSPNWAGKTWQTPKSSLTAEEMPSSKNRPLYKCALYIYARMALLASHVCFMPKLQNPAPHLHGFVSFSKSPHQHQWHRRLL